jgi:hypothetical protein
MILSASSTTDGVIWPLKGRAQLGYDRARKVPFLDSGISDACLGITVGNSPSIKERGSLFLELWEDRLTDVHLFA